MICKFPDKNFEAGVLRQNIPYITIQIATRKRLMQKLSSNLFYIMKTLTSVAANVTPPNFVRKQLIINRLYRMAWLPALVFLLNANVSLQAQTCPEFYFCMSAPYYDDVTHHFAIDVILNDFDDHYASGLFLRIEYSNTDFNINTALTTSSALSTLEEINATFKFNTPGEIELSGFQPPLTEGEVLTGFEEVVLFTIYFTAQPGACADFVFDPEFKQIYVVFPSGPSYLPCDSEDGMNCEPEDVCLNDVTISGIVESPVLGCDDSSNGGIVGILMDIRELNMIEDFYCSDYTEEDGYYYCKLVRGLDYRIYPRHDFNIGCGVTSLDIDLLMDHLLARDCLDYPWQVVAGDVDNNGSLQAVDALEMQKIIYNDPVTWPSWAFVPSSTYTGFTSPPGCGSTVPSYNEYIELLELADDEDYLDFVGIKKGDLNATCTDCSNPFTSEEEILVRNSPLQIDLIENEKGIYEVSFGESIQGLEVLLFAIPSFDEPVIMESTLKNDFNFITRYADGVFYISYASDQLEGESFEKGSMFMRISGRVADDRADISGRFNEAVINDNLRRTFVSIQGLQLGHLLYPNPTQGEVFLNRKLIPDSDGIRIKFYNAIGSLVHTIDDVPGSNSFDLSLPDGIYFYSIQAKNWIRSNMIIIE